MVKIINFLKTLIQKEKVVNIRYDSEDNVVYVNGEWKMSWDDEAHKRANKDFGITYLWDSQSFNIDTDMDINEIMINGKPSVLSEKGDILNVKYDDLQAYYLNVNSMFYITITHKNYIWER